MRKYGWKRQLPDFRDKVYVAPLMATLPQSVDLRPGCPPIYDQNVLGSCTANAIGGLIEYTTIELKKPDFMPSRLFIYYNERVMEGTVNEDSGAIIRDGMKVVNKLGACDEKLCPYIERDFKKKPSKESYEDAKKHLVTEYAQVNQDEISIKTCLATNNPVVFGFTVYSSFETEEVIKTGKMVMPSQNDDMMGGHAVLIVGYDDENKWYIVRNSWGSAWGDQGYFYMPYDYAHNSQLCDDFWTATIVL